jgi:hypothetical protein
MGTRAALQGFPKFAGISMSWSALGCELIGRLDVRNLPGMRAPWGLAVVPSLIALATFALPAQAREPHCDPDDPASRCLNVSALPALLTAFGGGSYTEQRVGLLGGDVLAGAFVVIERAPRSHSLLLIPTGGWSGWRTLGESNRVQANAFTGRLDLGYMNFSPDLPQGVTVFGAGRIGTARDRDCNCDPFLLRGAQIGIAYLPASALVFVEFQSNWTNYVGAWHHDLRVVVNVNVGLLLLPALVVWPQMRGM